MKNTARILCLIWFIGLMANQAMAQVGEIIAGPMLGHVDFREANIWLATQGAGTVELDYWKEGTPTRKKKEIKI